LLDETGFLLQPLNRRTWAARGMRPVQYASQRHDRLSVIGSLNMSPRRRRIGITFSVQDENVRTPHMVAYLRGLHRQLRRTLIVVMDRLNVHRAAARELCQAGAEWLHVEWLPPYAPDLNPVEAIWGHAKCCSLANFVPDDIAHLRDAVIESVGDLDLNERLKHSFFQTAQLPL
jgi:DDE superfamily endonuclease